MTLNLFYFIFYLIIACQLYSQKLNFSFHLKHDFSLVKFFYFIKFFQELNFFFENKQTGGFAAT
jgi:hypothetical protein